MGMDKKQKPTICVIGGSAAGMAASICAAREGAKVILIEGNEKLGRKIYATGNGKCNFLNIDQDRSHFHTSGDPAWISDALNCMDNDFVLTFFHELGLPSVVRHGGYYYPANESAATVVTCLEDEIDRLGVEVILSDRMRSLRYEDGRFSVQLRSGRAFEADAVILAMGGSASPKFGSDGSGYYYAKNFGHTIVEPLPALCPLKLKENGATFSVWAGTRINDASITLIIDEKPVISEKGEILFTDYGISGIPVFQVAGSAAIALEKNQKVSVEIDLAPGTDPEDAENAFPEWREYFGERTLQEQLSRIFPVKLIEALKVIPDRNKKMATMKATAFGKAFDTLKHLRFDVFYTSGFEQAQVSSGGVSLPEVEPVTMESKKQPGLYFAGELLDVYGDCGGYNLQFAFTSGAIAGRAAAQSCLQGGRE
ncbi:MAG: NAD(P)/FAD-dependent oxidoreductase [Lachnospiraceae bacterium]|nr:NAD(P)/FAD-dependent oxidoreductase [Lachnospiraceae bacterium]